MTSRVLGLALCAASMGFSQAPADWRFAHPDADMRLSLNLRAILQAPAVTAAIAKAQETYTPEQKAQTQFILGMLASVDRISISARQTAPAPGATAAPVNSLSGVATSSDALVLVSGTFDPKTVQSLFPSSGTSHVEQVGPNMILIGDGDSFTQAMKRMSGNAPSGPIDELSQSDVWLAGTPAMMTTPGAAAQPTLPALKELKTFSLGLNFRQSPELNLNLTATDPSGAAQILATLHGLMAVAGAAPQAALLEQLLQFKQEGSSVKLHMVIPAEVLAMAQGVTPGSVMDQLQPLLGMFGMASPGGTAKPAQAAPAPPPPSGDIVIYGLEDGPRVIKSNPPPAK